MYPIDYTLTLYDKNQDFSTSIVSKIMTLYYYWLDKNCKNFSPQFTFLRPSIYDLKTDEVDPSFLPSSQKALHHITYIIFLKHQKSENTLS